MTRVLPILVCLYNIKSLVATTCSGNQITWVNKNNSFVGCSPCPQCPPGQEPTIACNTVILEGTVARCIKCPTGKYSRFFDTKPCVHCKTCSKRYVKRACTLFRNTECGDCRPGYYYSDVVFDCIECEKCCRDGKDAVPTGCKKVGMCKPRSHGCPKDPSKSMPKLRIITVHPSTTERSSLTTSTKIPKPTPISPRHHTTEKSDTYPIWIVYLIVIVIVCVIIFVIIPVICIEERKKRKAHSATEPTSKNGRPALQTSLRQRVTSSKSSSEGSDPSSPEDTVPLDPLGSASR